MRSVFLFSAGCFFAASITAEANRWTRFGPFAPGGEPSAVAVSETGTVFAASNGGLFRGSDGGKSWILLDGSGGAFIRSLAVDGLTTVYAATDTGVIRSEDEGLTWTALNYRPGNQYASLVVTGGGLVYAAADNTLYRSSDRGESWTRLNIDSPNPVAAVAVDPRTGSTLYVATYYGVYKSIDAGVTWDEAFTGSAESAGISAVLVDPARPTTVYTAGIQGVFRSDDGGATWVKISGNLGEPGFGIAALAFDSSSTLYAVSGGLTFGGFVYRTRDQGATWSKLDVAGADAVVAVDRSAPSTLYLGLTLFEPEHKGGFITTTDGGTSWSSAGAPLVIFDVSDFAFERGRPGVVYALTQRGIWKTADGGVSWSSANAGLFDPADPSPAPVLAMAADASPAPALYAATAEGIVFKSTDGAVSWTRASSGLPSEPSHLVFALAVDPADRNTVYASSYTIFKTTDGGLSWSPASAGPAPFFATALTIDPTDHSTLYAAAGDLYKSVDGGASWQHVYRADGYEPVLSVAVDPASPSTVYAGTTYTGPSPMGGIYYGYVVKSTDGGATWVRAVDGMPSPDVSSIVVDPSGSGTVYAATSSGVYRSQDGGANWLPFQRGMSLWSWKLAFDLTSPSSLFAGGGAAFRATVDAGGACSLDFRTLCLNDRFQLLASYRNRDSGQQQTARAYRVTRDSGFFGFGSPYPYPPSGLADVAVKILDARGVNGRFWVLGGGLSDLDYSVEITDTASGSRKMWFHPQGPLASFADTTGFEPGTSLLSVGESRRTGMPAPVEVALHRSIGPAVPCATTENSVCLGDRFLVEAEWRAPGDALANAGAANVFSLDGSFWFFEPSNVELEVKVVDGRGLNGKFWVFYGSLTNVEFILTVTDTLTGAVKTYFNPQGQLASAADTSAF